MGMMDILKMFEVIVCLSSLLKISGCTFHCWSFFSKYFPRWLAIEDKLVFKDELTMR